MKKQAIIELGTRLGLTYCKKSNYAINDDKVIFDGCNGQRFLIESNWSDDKIYEAIGESLILFGKRLKSLELHRVISITDDF